MSMILITGTPGSGKTLFAVSLIVKLETQNKKNLKDNPAIFLSNKNLILENGFTNYFLQKTDSNNQLVPIDPEYFELLSLSDRDPTYFEISSVYNNIIDKIKKETGFSKLKHINAVRTIYSDINGLSVDHVLPAPSDWRTTPQGSVLFYDEAQQREIFQKTRSTLSDSPIVKKFEVHRHTGHDIYFITQSPIFLHSHIRELIGEHFHLHRPYGAKLASIYFWRMCQNNPNTKTAKAQVESTTLFNYDKKLFEYYKSATIHTHKLRIPAKLTMMIVGCIIAAVALYHFAGKSRYLSQSTPATQTTGPTSSNVAQSQPSAQSQAPVTLLKDAETKTIQDKMSELYSHNLQIVNYNPLLRVAGVIIKDDECKAFNIDGQRLNMPYMDCLQSTQNMFYGRSTEKSNDLRTNAHQGIDQQTEQQPAQTSI